MSDFRHKDGTGTLFDNSYKTSDKHPDLKGKATLPSGKVMDVSGWWKQNSKGEQYLSLSIQEEYIKDKEG